MYKTLLFIKYLDKGLIPFETLNGLDGNKLVYNFCQMTENDSIKAKRKFRKILKKAINFKLKKIDKLRIKKRYREDKKNNFKLSIGYKFTSSKINNYHKHQRRSLVHDYLISELDND